MQWKDIAACLAQTLNIDLQIKFPNVQVSDTTDDPKITTAKTKKILLQLRYLVIIILNGFNNVRQFVIRV